MSANNILTHYQNTFAGLLPQVNCTRNWQPRDNFKNADLENGHITFLYQGESGTDPTQIDIAFLIIARKYCGKSAKGHTIETTELDLLNQIRALIDKELPQIHIKKVTSSQQQECPDAWLICECMAGPFNFSGNDLLLGADQEITGFNISQAPKIGIPHKGHYRNVEDLA